jgi:hypothetical protein
VRRPSQPSKGAYSRGKQTTSLKPPFNPVTASLQAHKPKDLLKRLVDSSLSFYPFNSCQSAPPFKQRDILRKRVNSSDPFNPFTYPLEHPLFPPEPNSGEKESLLRKRTRFKPPFQHPDTPVNPTGRGEDLHPDTLQGHKKVTLQVPVSVLSPYSRKPGLFGANVSIFAKGVSKGVHNIAFSLWPDHFRAFDLKFFTPLNQNN